MAVRIHVTAVRDCPAQEVRATYVDLLGPAFEQVAVHEHDGWTWFSTSVWGVNAADLNKGLCALARPALQFTTSDGSRWSLTVHGGPEGRANFLHEFHLFGSSADPAHDAEQAENARQRQPEPIDPALAFLEDEPDAPERPWTAFDDVTEYFTDWGVRVPDDLAATLRERPYSQVIAGLREWHADSLLRALADARIPAATEAVRRVLFWEGVTPIERDSDLGNLPRLLSVLGLGGEWDDCVRQAEAPPPVVEDLACEAAQEFEPPDHAQTVLDLVEGLSFTPIQGGPVALPAKRMAQLGFASEACSTWPSPTMAVRVALLPGTRQPALEGPAEDDHEVLAKETPDGYLIGLLNRTWYSLHVLESGMGKDAANLVLKPKDGTMLEANFAVPGEPATYHRFRGAVRDGRWWVGESYPPLDHVTLACLVEVAPLEAKAKVSCRDETEAIALETAAREDNHLHNMGVTRAGAVVSCSFDAGHLAKLLLRLRLHDAFDFSPALAHEAAERAKRLEMAKAMRRANVEAARQRAAPHDRDVLFKGDQSIFWRSDFLKLDQLDQAPRLAFEEAVNALGFRLVGDLVAKKQRDIVLRVFLAPDRLSYAVLMAKRTMYLGQEFVSRLEDGSGLTTTTNAAQGSDPETGAYFRTFPGLAPADLYAKHVEGLGRFRTRKGLGAVALDDTLEGVAREIDIALARQRADDLE